jgi:alkylation response protein AidB-like acyl-CoA dehydrogenase
MVGEENRGWYIGATLLDFERSLIRNVIGLRQDVEALVEYARDTAARGVAIDHPAVRLEFADRLVESDIARLFSHRIIGLQKLGRVPNHEASMNKLFLSETDQRIAQTGMRLIGAHGLLDRGAAQAPGRGRFARHYLRSPAISIAGGTSEVQRNVIATRGLGLPRG